MDVAVVGSGGREHELGRQLAMADDVQTIHFINGNAGTEQLPKGHNVAIKPTNVTEIARYASEKTLELVVVGPEAPLAAGLGNTLRAKDIPVFGPNAEAAKLETSKSYAAAFMIENGIPHPLTATVENYDAARTVLQGWGPKECVIKADGLAGGKGVALPDTLEEGEATLREMLAGGYGGAGKHKIVIQKRYHGPEVSAFVVSDGNQFAMLPHAQDHKRLLDKDKGPNTGGMGAYTPVPARMLNQRQEQGIYDIAERTIQGMKRRGTPYSGVLYIGLMLAEELNDQPVVIEHNARFGDPEAEVVLPVLSEAGVDTFELLRSAAEGRLQRTGSLAQVGTAALTVCLAADGYPQAPQTGQVIHGLDGEYDGVILHHAGTKRARQRTLTSGGRALYVTGVGENVDEAAAKAYSAVGSVHFAGMHYRRDIGHQARAR